MSFLLGLVKGAASAAVESRQLEKASLTDALEKHRERMQAYEENRKGLAFGVSPTSAANYGWVNPTNESAFYSQNPADQVFNVPNYGKGNELQTFRALVNATAPDGVTPLADFLFVRASAEDPDAIRDLQNYAAAIDNTVMSIQRNQTIEDPTTGEKTREDITNILDMDSSGIFGIGKGGKGSRVLQSMVITSQVRAANQSLSQAAFGDFGEPSSLFPTTSTALNSANLTESQTAVIGSVAASIAPTSLSKVEKITGINIGPDIVNNRINQMAGFVNGSQNKDNAVKGLKMASSLYSSGAVEFDFSGTGIVNDFGALNEVAGTFYTRGKYTEGSFRNAARALSLAMPHDYEYKEYPTAEQNAKKLKLTIIGDAKADHFQARFDIVNNLYNQSSQAKSLITGWNSNDITAQKGIAKTISNIGFDISETFDSLESAYDGNPAIKAVFNSVKESFGIKDGKKTTDPFELTDDGQAFKNPEAAQRAANAYFQYLAVNIDFAVARFRQTASDRTTGADIEQATKSTGLQTNFFLGTTAALPVLNALITETGAEREYIQIMQSNDVRAIQAAHLLRSNMAQTYLRTEYSPTMVEGMPDGDTPPPEGTPHGGTVSGDF